MSQLSLGIGAPPATPGFWVCGICYARRPDGKFWCSHLVDPLARDALHARLDGCAEAGCCWMRPCAPCREYLVEHGLPFASGSAG